MMARTRATGSTAAARAGRRVAPSSSQQGARPHVVARLVPLEPGFYAFALAAGSAWREPVAGFALPAIHVASPPDRDAGLEITDSFGRAGSWLGGRNNALFVKSPASGGAALVTAYLARDPNAAPLELEIRRLASARPGAPSVPSLTLRLGEPTEQEAPAGPSLEFVAHIRGRGDLRFVDAEWVGRLGRGLWIEAFAILPHDKEIAAAIEYKGLSAGGAESAWLDSGARCGTQGRALPLVGFAVRQKALPGGARLDCEYSGYFSSGATAGPMRNGAPCRSAADNDPLEGMQLRITQRPSSPATAKE